MPKPYPSEFRNDGVRVASRRSPGVTIEQIAKDLKDHPMKLQKWMCRYGIDEGARPGQAFRANALFDEHRYDPDLDHRLLADEAHGAGEAMSARVVTIRRTAEPGNLIPFRVR